jgi:hypothetical protein
MFDLLKKVQNQELWQKIKQFEFEKNGLKLSFPKRLARDNGWKFDFALRAIFEYKKFVYLMCVSGQPLTPSDAVDQVWHLHLLYTQSYWIDFCQKTLQKTLHHNPTAGGIQEREKFFDWYEQSRKLYEAEFGMPAPKDIWPNGIERFKDIDFVRVNLRKYWLIPKLW